jgi:hypothetical protein
VERESASEDFSSKLGFVECLDCVQTLEQGKKRKRKIKNNKKQERNPSGTKRKNKRNTTNSQKQK